MFTIIIEIPILFNYLFIFGCTVSLLLHSGLVAVIQAALHCGAQASYCSGFSGRRALTADAEARGLSSCGLQPLVHRFSSCDALALAALRHVESSWTTD